MASTPAPSLLWLEGVNFAETLDDTTTLSVIRGASLALLAAPGPALDFLRGRDPGYECVFAGASIALFRAPRTEAAIRDDAAALLAHLHEFGPDPDRTGQTPPLAHLRFVAGTAADDGTASGPALAQGRARSAQLGGHLPRRATQAGRLGPCLFSQQRVAERVLHLRRDHAERFGATEGGVPISNSALARWHYGRHQRQEFYRARPALRGLLGAFCVTDNLQDMVDLRGHRQDQQPQRYGRYRQALPFALFDKLAVIYADGNGFGGIRKAMGGTPDALRDFSRQADAVLEQGLAAAFGVVARHATGHHHPAAVFHDAGETEADRREQLRFETLLYGGDEIAFVAPVWFGLAMAAAFFTAVEGREVTWQQDGKTHRAPLTFSMGVALVSVSMPIRASYNLAKDLSEGCKPAPEEADARIPDAERWRNRLAIHAFESIEPPGNGLAALRASLFGGTRSTHCDAAGRTYSLAHPLLALDGASFAERLAGFAALKASVAVPRSQLFRMLGAAHWPQRSAAGLGRQRQLGDPGANEAAATLFKAYLAGAGAAGDAQGGWAACLADETQAAMAAWLMTHLWDYTAPLDGIPA